MAEAPGLSLLWNSNSYEGYQRLLVDTPIEVQGAVGLAILMVLLVPTLLLITREFRGIGLFAALVFGAAWLVIHSFLPVHFSSVDLDGVFVHLKYIGGLEPGMTNRQPFFTWADFLYRIPDLFGIRQECLSRYAVNGVLWWLYQLNFLLILKRFLAEPVRARFSRTATYLLLVAVMANIRFVLVSTTVFMALAGGTMLLLSFNLIEFFRTRERILPAGYGALLAGCLLVSFLQLHADNQYTAISIPILAHAILALWQHRSGFARVLPIAALLATSVTVFAIREIFLARTGLSEHGLLAWAVVLVAHGILAFLLVSRLPIREFLGNLRDRVPESLGRAAILAYFLGMFGLFFTEYLFWWTPLPYLVDSLSGHTAVDRSRYSCLFFPFFVVLVGHLLFVSLRLRRRTLGILSVVLVLVWNIPTMTGFYKAPPLKRILADRMLPDAGPDTDGPILVEDARHQPSVMEWVGLAADAYLATMGRYGFEANTRRIEDLADAPNLDWSLPVYYLPLPRDGSDLLLIKAVNPEFRAVNACEILEDQTISGALVYSSLTAMVADEEGMMPPLRTSVRPLLDPAWNIQVFPVEQVDRELLREWCDSVCRRALETRDNGGNGRFEHLGCFHPEPSSPSRPPGPISH
jgi:hypothetical protein